MVTLTELDKLCREFADTKEAIRGLENERKEKESHLRDIQDRIMAHLSESGKHTYEVNGVGKLIMVSRTSVKTPKSPEDRAAFFDYLKNRGLFDDLITVNSQTLNAFYREELKNARENGQMDIDIPGLEPPKESAYLSIRKS